MRACNWSAVMRTSLRADPTSRSSKSASSSGAFGAGRAAGAAAGSAGEPHLAMLAPGAYPARQVDPALSAPGDDQLLDPLDMPGGQRAVRAARHDRGVPQDPGPDRSWQVVEMPGVQAGRV